MSLPTIDRPIHVSDTEMVWSVAFSPDGNRIATAIVGFKATIKIWSAAPLP